MMKKWITTAVLVALALATECVKGQDDINPRSRGRRVSYCGKMFVSPVVVLHDVYLIIIHTILFIPNHINYP